MGSSGAAATLLPTTCTRTAPAQIGDNVEEGKEDGSRGTVLWVPEGSIVVPVGGRPKNPLRRDRILAILCAYRHQCAFGASSSQAYEWIGDRWPGAMYQDEGSLRRIIREARKIAPWTAFTTDRNFCLLAPDAPDGAHQCPDPNADGWVWKVGELAVYPLPGAGRVLAEALLRMLDRRIASGDLG